MRIYKYPEQMTPGSFWKVKGVKGMRFLEDKEVIGYFYKGWSPPATFPNIGKQSIQTTKDWEPRLELGVPYMLVKIEHEGGMILASFLSGEEIIDFAVFETFWDKAFRLARRSIHPKQPEEYMTIFDKYAVSKLKNDLGFLDVK